MKRNTKILWYKGLCLAFAVLLAFVPRHGAPYSDIRVLATAIGLDGEKGNVTVSAQLAVPVVKNSGGQASTVAQSQGGSVGEALENLEIGLGRRIDYGHMSSIVFGSDMKTDDMQEFVGYLLSSGKVGPGAFLAYCPSGSASEFMDGAQYMGENSEAEISKFISYSKRGNHVATTNILEFLQGLNSVSDAAYLPCVELEDDNGGSAEEGGQGGGDGEQNGGQDDAKEDSGEKSGGGDGGGSGSGGNQKKKLVTAERIAVISGKNDSPSVLDTLTTRGIAWQDRKSNFGMVEVRNVILDGEEVSSVSARLTDKKVKRKVNITDGENTVSYEIKIQLALEEPRLLCKPIHCNELKKTLEDEFASLIENNIKESVATSKRIGIDFLGLKENFYKFCRKGYDNFKLEDVAVCVKAKVKILS